MKTIAFLAVIAAIVAFPSGAGAHPQMAATMAEIVAREPEPFLLTSLSTSLIGDLLNVGNSLSSTGSQIKQILQGDMSAEDTTSKYFFVPPRDSFLCRRDTCCIWKYIADEMAAAMIGSAGRCNDLARGSIRLGFHDAGAWSKFPAGQNAGAGATGSVVLAGECETRRENNGLEATCAQMRTWANKYSKYGVGMADLIQMAANVATVTCPLGPRIRSYVGRTDNATPAPPGLLPSPFASADSLIAMFEAKTFTSAGLIALLGAHTTSQQRTVNVSRAGDPQDSTPGVWDVKYYSETTATNPPEKVFRFQSDINLANDPRTAPVWQSFSSPVAGQLAWNRAYAREYVRMSILGVNNINSLTDCTKVLPTARTVFVNRDQNLLSQFLSGKLPSAVKALLRGDLIG